MTKSNKLYFHPKSHEEANFYAQHLNIDREAKINNFYDKPLDEKSMVLNLTLKDLNQIKNKDNAAKEIKELYNNGSICLNDWFWLTDEQKRAINWKWGFIKLNQYEISRITSRKFTSRITKETDDEEQLNFSHHFNDDNTNPTSKSKLNYIIRFLSNLNSIKKAKFIEEKLYSIWSDVLNEHEIESYLDISDTNMCKWVFNYLKS